MYSIRSHHHKTINLQDQTCPVCKNRGVLKMHLMQQYASFIISFMPGGKYAIFDCDFCKKTLPNKLISKELWAIFRKERKATKTPLRFWAGLIMMVFAFATLTLLFQFRVANPFNLKRVNSNEATNKLNVQNFKEGDVLFIDFRLMNENGTNAERKTAAKVIKIEGDKTTIKVYTDDFEFLDQYDLELSDLDEAKYKEEIEIKTDRLRTFRQLIYYNPPSEKIKNLAFGVARVVIQE